MNTHSTVPHTLQQASDRSVVAMPIRLSGLRAFDAGIARTAPVAPRPDQARRPLHHAYLRPSALPALVRIHS